MQFKQKLLVFPTSRAVRAHVSLQKNKNTLLPSILTIDEFFKKSISFENKKYIDEEQRFLYLKESIKNTDIKKLGISDNFTKFLKQNDYIYRFFLELSSEKIEINDIRNADTYEYFNEHLSILEEIRANYIKILDENSCVDRINMAIHYKVNKSFLKRFDYVDFIFEGYFTKVEFDIIQDIASIVDLNISFYSNEYNQKSLEKFDFLEEKIELNRKYEVSLTNKTLLKKEVIENKLIALDIKGFNSRINQIAYIKSSITKAITNGVNPSSIALVLPDESFASWLQLFDNEQYFNYAMGRNIKNYKLYQVAYAVNSYLNEDEVKNISNIEYLKIDKAFIDKDIKSIWNKICTKNNFDLICTYIKSNEDNEEIIEKYDEVIYKLNILLFSEENSILVKDLYKIFLQKISKITLDDVNSGKITVLGLLETRAVSFDTVIICDFNENFIPKRSIKDKFLSTKIKSMADLPTSYDRESLQKYYYKRLIDSSYNLFISYVNSDTNQISRFANELFPEKIDTNRSDNLYKHILYNNHNITHYEGDIIEKIDLTQFEWSATSFKNFLECKRKFYFQHILKIKEHTISLKPKGFELGSIVHSILEKYYINESNDLSYKVIEDLFYEYRTSNPFLALDLEIWKKKLYNFYLYDKERLENRKIIALEQNFNIVFDDMKIKGVIDRVDLYTDTYEVIDYKTSSSLKIDSLKNYEKSNDFQLEFYYLAMSEIYKTDKVNAFYYDLNNTKLEEEIALDKKLELLTQKFSDIKDLSKDAINFDKCDEKVVCTYCPYSTICNR
ncbi:PD-(D/E)XK nuclease family protein [Poseidonibacter lekithochrous]|uniref:PD-(D/E)XK nuclease family protein n=1 Tax=Poseidonibacter TaxID=2321187 RepID=UPI001C08E75A|nr:MULTISPECIES: PD-(D/E)XK nuclease family protein [Poseidonibacter]MBU3014567.1 PD-(D/E)XK nuclease family protein [Poseidonibacter lekithochrous]MDO6827865.1 PD-(D/E)XK nuclease family protein [Poseidonibacter sp. 1_MG-2023]